MESKRAQRLFGYRCRQLAGPNPGGLAVVVDIRVVAANGATLRPVGPDEPRTAPLKSPERPGEAAPLNLALAGRHRRLASGAWTTWTGEGRRTSRSLSP